MKKTKFCLIGTLLLFLVGCATATPAAANSSQETAPVADEATVNPTVTNEAVSTVDSTASVEPEVDGTEPAPTEEVFACSSDKKYVVILYQLQTHKKPDVSSDVTGYLDNNWIVEIAAEMRLDDGSIWYRVEKVLNADVIFPAGEHWFSRLPGGFLQGLACDNDQLVNVPSVPACVRALAVVDVLSETGDIIGSTGLNEVFSVVESRDKNCLLVDPPERFADNHTFVCVNPEAVASSECK